MQWRYGVKECLEGGIDGSIFEVIEVFESDKYRVWTEPSTLSDSLAGVAGVMEMIARDVKDLTQPDITTTLHEWWWTDTPDVKYPTGEREDDEEGNYWMEQRRQA